MEQQNILTLLNEGSDSKCLTRKCSIANDQSNGNGSRNEIIYNTEVLKSNLYDYNDAYILVRGKVTIARNVAVRVTVKNCAPFTRCITKIVGKTIDNAEDLHLVMSVYNFLEYSWNYSWPNSLWFYSKDEAANFNDVIAGDDNLKLFKHKTKLIGSTPVNICWSWRRLQHIFSVTSFRLP